MHISLTTAQSVLLRTGVHTSSALDDTSLFILQNGLAPATTRQYASAVNKFLAFCEGIDELAVALPAPAGLIYRFILWCSAISNTTVAASTIKRYLTGLRMWHTLHDAPFPLVNAHRIRLLLKACSKTQVTRPHRKRTGVTLRDVLSMCDHLATSSTTDLVTRTVILVGFWGLARLGELTRHPDHPSVFVRRRDLSFSLDGHSAYIRIRLAKTAAPDEVQLLKIRAQPNRLDLVNALRELLESAAGSPNDPLFPGSVRGEPIRRSHVTKFLKAHGPQDNTYWSGHSLCIGGASFQHHAGRPIASLKRLGRWRSSAYKGYVRKYSPSLRASSLSLSRALHF